MKALAIFQPRLADMNSKCEVASSLVPSPRFFYDHSEADICKSRRPAGNPANVLHCKRTWDSLTLLQLGGVIKDTQIATSWQEKNSLFKKLYKQGFTLAMY